MIKRFFLLLLILGGSIQMYAQQISYTWENGGIRFQVPFSIVEKENTETSYEASNDDLVVNIQLLDDPDSNVAEMKKTLKELMSDIGVTEPTEITELHLQNGLQGVYLEGDIDNANACMAIVLDATAKVEWCFMIVYNDGMEEVAEKVLQSVAKK